MMEMPPDWEALGRLIGERRRALGLPKNEAARQAKLSNTTWRLIEAGANRNPTDETLVRIALVIKMDPEELLTACGRGMRPHQAEDRTRARRAVPTVPPRIGLGARALPRELPQTHMPYFTGRDEYLDELTAHLEHRRPPVPPLVVCGLSGVGKTALALRYLLLHRDAYDDVGWVRAGTPQTRDEDLARLAKRLKPSSGADPVDLAAAVLAALVTDGRRWLVVFDGADQASEVERFLPDLMTAPGLGQVRLLLTSRQGAGWLRAKTLPLGPLSKEHAIDFLWRRAGHETERVADAERSAKAAEQLAEELGCLPSALENAGAYVDETGISLASFLDLARELSATDRLIELLDAQVEDGAHPPWNPIDELKEARSTAFDLLRFVSFLAPTPIRPSRLTRQAAELPETLSGLRGLGLHGLKTAVATLRRRSLVTVDGDGFQVHRLVQAEVRRALPETERRRWAAVALNVVEHAFPVPDGSPENRRICAQLLPHAQAAVAHAQLYEGDRGTVGRLLGRVAEHLLLEGHLREARSAAEQSLALLQPADPAAVPVLHTLALALADLAHVQPALDRLDEALRLAEATGAQPIATQLILARLAAMEAHVGRYESALERLEAVCDFLADTDAADRTLETADLMSGVALTLSLVDDDPDKARRWFGEALTLRRAQVGSLHPGIGLDLYGLASIELRRRSLHQAAYWFEEGIDVYRRLYGQDAAHPRIADGLRGMGTVMSRLGNIPAALDHLNGAQRIYLAAYGAGVERGRSNRQANDHPALKAVESTIELLRDILDVEAKQSRRDPERVAVGIMLASEVERQRYTERRLAIGNQARGFDGPAEAVTALRMGNRLLNDGDVSGALACFERSAKYADTTMLVGLKARMGRGQAFEKLERHDEALINYQAIVDAVSRLARKEPARRVGRRASVLYPTGVQDLADEAGDRLEALRKRQAAATLAAM